MAFTIFSEDSSKYSVSWVSFNLDYCLVEYFTRLLLLTYLILFFDDSPFTLFSSPACFCKNAFYTFNASSLFCNFFQYFSLTECLFIFSIRHWSIRSRYSYLVNLTSLVGSCGINNIYCDSNGFILIRLLEMTIIGRLDPVERFYKCIMKFLGTISFNIIN